MHAAETMRAGESMTERATGSGKETEIEIGTERRKGGERGIERMTVLTERVKGRKASRMQP